jgi:hypothetical protein
MANRYALPMLTCEGCGACCEEVGLPPTYTKLLYQNSSPCPVKRFRTASGMS